MKVRTTKLFIDCEEAKHICNKSQYNESSWWERFRLNLRFLYCNITRAYVKKNQKLTELVTDKKVECMDKSKKDNLRIVFEKALKN